MTRRALTLGAVAMLVLATGGIGAWVMMRDGSTDPGRPLAVEGPTYRSGPFRLAVGTVPATPVVGRNRLVIRLEDAEGNPVSGAEIRAVATMPAMGDMPAMQAPVDIEALAPGRYVGTFGLRMSGAWPLTLEIEKPELGASRISFDMATGREGLELATGGRRVDEPDREAQTDREAQAANVAEDMPTVRLDNRRRQLIGLETELVERRRLTRTIRAVGEVVYDETRLHDVTLKFDGWIGELTADAVGITVERGQELFTVYSPELLSAQQEYLETRARLARRGPDDSLMRAARRRLQLWDIAPEQIRALERRGEPLEHLPIHAPAAGVVVEKHVVEGAAVARGRTLLRIADLSSVWIDAQVYDSELALVQPGMTARITLPYLPQARYRAEVEYVYPYLQGGTRTGRLRLSLPNADGRLKPQMYAQVELQAELGERLAVPESAVLFSGDARLVFVDLGEGRLQPRYVEIGQRAADYLEVTAGLEAGERVVTSGTFLLDAETRLKTGIKQW